MKTKFLSFDYRFACRDILFHCDVTDMHFLHACWYWYAFFARVLILICIFCTACWYGWLWHRQYHAMQILHNHYQVHDKAIYKLCVWYFGKVKTFTKLVYILHINLVWYSYNVWQEGINVGDQTLAGPYKWQMQHSSIYLGVDKIYCSTAGSDPSDYT
jgi:hypothetical protein